MPELSRPLIAILGVVISVAVLFIAVAGFLPFFQQSITSTTQQASFTATASATQTGGNTVFAVNVQKLVGSGTYTISSSDVTLYNSTGDSVTFTMTPSSVSFSSDTTSVGFSLTTSDTSTGTWAIVIIVRDSNSNAVQTITLSVEVG